MNDPEPQNDRLPAGPHRSSRLALARHGETVWHADNRYAGGSSDIDLTPEGRAQASALALWTRAYRPDAVICSPVRRAVETAELSAIAAGVQLEQIEELREVDFGMAEGRTAQELAQADPALMHRFKTDPVAHPFPGSENPEAAALRAAEALRAIAARYVGGKVLVVAHNTLLRLGMCSLLGFPVSRYRILFPRLDNAAISELAVPTDSRERASLLTLNVHVGTPP